MAVARMRRVQILAHREIRSEVFRRVRDLEIMEVVSAEELPQGVMPGDRQERAAAYSDELSKLSFIRSYFERYTAIKKSFIDMFTGKKPEIHEDELGRLILSFDLHGTYEKLRANDQRLKEIAQETAEIESQLEALRPWADLDISLNFTGGTESTDVALAVFPVSAWEASRSRLESLPAYYQVVGEGPARLRVFIACFRSPDFDVKQWIVMSGGAVETLQLSLPEEHFRSTPSQAIGYLMSRLEALGAEKQAIEASDSEMAGMLVGVLGLLDYYLDQKNIEEVQSDVPHTDHILVVEGWVRAKDMDRLRSSLSDLTELTISDREPLSGEQVPIYLENHPLIQPFEVITNIFGYPGYDEVDPTPILAPFFWLFFGITLADAVYGVALTLGMYFFLKTQRLSVGGQKLVRLLMYSGVSTALVGVLTGSWMADMAGVFFQGTAIQRLTAQLTIINPIDDPVTMLVVSLAFGIVQIWVGIAVKFYSLARRGEMMEAVLSQGSWLLFLPGLITWALSSAGVIQSQIPFYVMVAGAALVMISSSRGQKNLLLKPFAGLYGLYGTIGYFSDTMSYARLLALGLASAIIGVVINKIAQLVVSMIPVVGWVLLPVILLVGHLFNLTINALGSFIHSGRLQFVEFFTKFFEGGGKPFRPLTRINENVFVNKT